MPHIDELAPVVAAWAAPRGRRGEVLEVQDLTPGLSAALVARVRLVGDPGSLVLKRPAGGGRSLVARDDAAALGREAAFFRSALRDRVATAIRLPETAVVEFDDGTWLVQEDLQAALATDWDPAAAGRAVEQLAPLASIPVDQDAEAWLEHEGWAAYTATALEAAERIDALRAVDRWTGAMDADAQAALVRILRRTEAWEERMRALPQVLVHGDAHPGNAGFDAERLCVVDWEHVGLGAPGFDAATVVAGFHLFGGVGPLDERRVLKRYLAALPTDVEREHAAEGFWLSFVTWALQIRLGPGATAVREGLLGRGSATEAAALADIVEGCHLALTAERELAR